jgi:two-component system cell cycle response regulator
VAARLKRILSSEDLLARIGGEEFLIVVPQTRLEDAQHIAENICFAIHSEPFELPRGLQLQISLSIGLALIQGSQDLIPKPGNPSQSEIALDRLIDRADQALLSAKALGRNRVKVDQNSG